MRGQGRDERGREEGKRRGREEGEQERAREEGARKLERRRERDSERARGGGSERVSTTNPGCKDLEEQRGGKGSACGMEEEREGKGGRRAGLTLKCFRNTT